jgi:hypothetical protein
MKNLVAVAIDKRLPITDQIKLIVCFDPAVRDVILPRADCEQLLMEAFNKLSEYPRITELFSGATKPASAADESVAWTQNSADVDSLGQFTTSSVAKRLRLSLLMESNPSASASVVDRYGLNDEIRRYMAIHDDAPALEFWKLNADSFPVLSTMAHVYLAVSPGSVPFNCLFSTTGLRLNNKLVSAIAPYRLNTIAFLHDNLDISLL